MSLTDDLLAQQRRSRERLGPERTRLFEEAIADLAGDIAARKGIAVGEVAPDFCMPNQSGQNVTLGEKLGEGSVVLAFYRGAWCPYCNIQLRALQDVLPRLRTANAALIAISPQTPDDTLTLTERDGLSFDVLSDVGCVTAEAYGIAFALPHNLREIYTSMGNTLPERNAADDWRLPIPATFVVAPDGKVAFTDIDADYRKRAEPENIVNVVESLKA
ncbi:MAG: peroxiredoxin-like family protein [Alphaproteobacteria bacterium]|jgi:peroxiredoxin|nr:peroxiredoxin-like family protein [Alphaproteobacteria bacterium]